MKGTKKWFVVSIIFMLLVITACTNSNSETEAVKELGEQRANHENGSEDANAFPLSQPLELHFMAAKNPLVQKDYSEMTPFKEMEQRSNIKITWDLVIDWTEHFNLMMASGDLPDAFFGRGGLTSSQLVELSGQGLLVPLDGLIEEHAPNIKAFFDKHPEAKASFLSPDGKLYTVPTIFYFDHHRVGTRMFINKNWLDQIGRDIPETTEEFYEVLKAFREQDMNGNGIQDEIPFTFQYPDGQRGPWGISSAFGMTDNAQHVYVRDGELRFAPLEEGYKEYVKYMHRLKSEGLIDQEAFTHNEQTYIAKIRENPSTVGAFIGWVWTTYFESKESSGYVALPPLIGPNGHRSYPHSPMSWSAGGLAITTKNPDPVATIKWYDMIYADEELAISLDYGPRGVNWDYTDNGGLEFLPPPEGMVFEEFRHMDAPGNRGPTSYTPEMYQKLAKGEKGIQESLELVEVYRPYLDEHYVPNLIMTFEDNDRVTQLSTDINEYVQTQFARWVFDGGVEEEWDAFQAQLERMGVHEMMEIRNKYYKKLVEAQ